MQIYPVVIVLCVLFIMVFVDFIHTLRNTHIVTVALRLRLLVLLLLLLLSG